MRRDELPGRVACALDVAEAREKLALVVDDAHARPEVRRGAVHAHDGAALADVADRALARRHVEAARAVQVVPLRLVAAVAVEHLHAMALAVGDVHPAVVVAADVVRQIELAGARARARPTRTGACRRRVLMDARVAVAVGDVEVAFRRQRRMRAAVERLLAHVRRWAGRRCRASSARLPSSCTGARCDRRRR